MPPLSRTGAVVAALILLLFSVVGGIVLVTPVSDPLRYGVRLASLWGLLAMGIALLLAPFLKEVRRAFGRPFLQVHHAFAWIGLAAITLHPTLVALSFASPSVFIPVTDSISGFLSNGGRFALPLIYIGVVAAVLMRRVREWRYLHLLLYVALPLGMVHGFLISGLFGSPVLAGLFLLLGLGVIGTFLAKRWQRRGRPAAAAKKG